MKAKIYSIDGEAKKEINLPDFFSERIREDIIAKAFEAKKIKQPYAASLTAGKLYSATGKIKHVRHKWKTAYGYGISRVPRKIFWRRGTRFYWQGAEVSGTVGGRRAHPPKAESFLNKKRINKNEMKKAIASALAATSVKEAVAKRYETAEKFKTERPIVIDSEFFELTSKQFFESLKKVLHELYNVSIQKKSIRAGRGKSRGRKYRKNAGAIILLGKNEKLKIGGIEIKKAERISISDLYPLGRIVIYTEKAIQELERRLEK
jgi:large subunit ribosomal protein L4e